MRYSQHLPNQAWPGAPPRSALAAHAPWFLLVARGIHAASHPLVSAALLLTLFLATMIRRSGDQAPSRWGLLLLGASLATAVLSLKPAYHTESPSPTLPLWAAPPMLLGTYVGLVLICASLWSLPAWPLVALGGLAFVSAGWLAVALSPALSLRCFALAVPAVLAWIVWRNPWPALLGLPLAGWAQMCLRRRCPAHLVAGGLLGGLFSFGLLILLIGG